MTSIFSPLRTKLAVLAFCSLALAAHAFAPPRINAQQLWEDVAFIRQTVAQVHPDLRHSADPRALAAALDAIAADAPAELTRDEAWQRLATLNPVFADGHLFVGYPDWRADGAAHLAAGGLFFPFEVDIREPGQLSIRAALGGGATELAGARILAIDGVPAQPTTAALLQRAHGDTPLFRARLLAERWWLYHWKMVGAPAHYRLGLERAGRHWTVDVPASAATPVALSAATDFARQFSFTIRPDGVAVLKAGSFYGAFKDRFLALAHAAFARLRDEHVMTLQIDISDNSGGDDDVWLEGLMPYLATQPYRTGSTYRKRVLEPRAGSGETAGQVVEGEIQTWRQPEMDNPLRFKGKLVVVIGPATYSSAVLFANVIRDFGFGTLAGTGNAARRTQSGGIRKFVLPHSGLALWVPRFVLDPPAGASPGAMLAPATGNGMP